MRVRVTVDAEKATEEFKQARRDVNKRMREGLKRAGEKVALPAAKRNASHLRVEGQSVASSLIIRATSRDAYLTTRLNRKKGRAVGLQEYGGIVSTKIIPKKGNRAVVVNGQPVAYVDTPRHYKGQKFMTRAVESNRQRIGEAVRDELMHAFDGLDWE